LFQALKTPNGFSGYLYKLVTEDLGISDGEVIDLIKGGTICQGGHCYDLGDVGSNCC
jgi:hypothetical protein